MKSLSKFPATCYQTNVSEAHKQMVFRVTNRSARRCSIDGPNVAILVVEVRKKAFARFACDDLSLGDLAQGFVCRCSMSHGVKEEDSRLRGNHPERDCEYDDDLCEGIWTGLNYPSNLPASTS